MAGIGGEEKADIKPEARDGFVGPGMALNKALKGEMEIVGTIICGDSYFNENLEEAKAEILEMVKKYEPDMFIAGPAFNAGRYGAACGAICKHIQDELNIPVITAMYEENPGVDMFRKDLYIVQTGNSAAAMRKAVPALAKLAIKVCKGEELGTPAEDGYHARGLRKNLFVDKIGGERAVEMLTAKLAGKEFVTEYPMPEFDNVDPGAAVKDMSKAKLPLLHLAVLYLRTTLITLSHLQLQSTVSTILKVFLTLQKQLTKLHTAVTILFTVMKIQIEFFLLTFYVTWKKKVALANYISISTQLLVTVHQLRALKLLQLNLLLTW